MNEIWKDIQGYKGLYQISNLGRVKSSYKKQPKILKNKHNNRHYCIVGLYKDGAPKYFLVHRLVAQAFIPNPNSKPQVNHINENKEDNSVNNLEWVTEKENANWGTRIQRTVKNTDYEKRSKNTDYSFANKYKKPIKVVYPDGTTLMFDSATDASRIMGINVSGIRNVLKHRQKTTGNGLAIFYV